MNKNIAYIDHADCLLHNMGNEHPESPDRMAAIKNQLQYDGLFDNITHYQAPLATRNQLTRVHDGEYVDHVLSFKNQQTSAYLDPDTLIMGFTPQAALRAAGAAILATDLVLTGEHKRAFCNVRPPGHHALRNRAMGFCFFNNVAIATAQAVEKYGLERVAIVDFDVHHGNGTEDIFRDDTRVMLCSTFQHPFYPYSGANTQSDHIINIPLVAGTDGGIFRKAIERYCIPTLQKFSPQLIIFSAGFDAHENDLMANLCLQADDYAWVTREIMSIADQYAEGRAVSLLEGGYELKALGESVAAHINALI